MSRPYDPDEALHTVLAALRTYQQYGPGARGALPAAILEIATNAGRSDLLDASGIDALCEDLGFGRLFLQSIGSETQPPKAPLTSCSPCSGDRPEEGTLHTEAMLVLSTAHMEPADDHVLSEQTEVLPFAVMARPEGYLLHTHVPTETQDLGLSDVLFEALAFARQMGCEWLLLDCAGPTCDELPTGRWPAAGQSTAGGER